MSRWRSRRSDFSSLMEPLVRPDVRVAMEPGVRESRSTLRTPKDSWRPDARASGYQLLQLTSLTSSSTPSRSLKFDRFGLRRHQRQIDLRPGAPHLYPKPRCPVMPQIEGHRHVHLEVFGHICLQLGASPDTA